eukprot:119216-Pelagomonas_calceolata.AAC.4
MPFQGYPARTVVLQLIPSKDTMLCKGCPVRRVALQLMSCKDAEGGDWPISLDIFFPNFLPHI